MHKGFECGNSSGASVTGVVTKYSIAARCQSRRCGKSALRTGHQAALVASTGIICTKFDPFNSDLMESSYTFSENLGAQRSWGRDKY